MFRVARAAGRACAALNGTNVVLSDVRYAGVEELVHFTDPPREKPCLHKCRQGFGSSIGTAGFEPATP